MNVAVAQHQFRNLADLMKSAGAAAGLVNGLAAIADALAPFAGLKVEDFATFLVKAEEYHRTGVVPASPSKGRTRKSPGEPTKLREIKPAPEPTKAGRDAADEIGRVFEGSADPGVTYDQMEAALRLLDAKGVVLKDLEYIGQRVGVLASVRSAKGKPAKQEVIRKQVRDRRAQVNRPNY